jgi:hypothetical protein
VRGGTRVAVSDRALALLEILARARPRALSKEELLAALWPEVVVAEGSLMTLVSELRRALHDSRRDAQFVRTVHGFGYAFTADVVELPARAAPAAVPYRLELDGRDVPLAAGENVIGRDEDVHVRVDRSTVSRRHARVMVSAEGATLEDLGSKNGTWLDGSPVSGPTKLVDGAVVKVGAVALVFKSPGRASTRTLRRG